MNKGLKILLLTPLVLSSPTQAQSAAAIPTYYEDHASIYSANNSYFAYLYFKAIPAGEYVTITNISCRITVPSTSISITSIALVLDSRILDLPTQSHIAANQTIADFNIPIRFKVGAGRTPYVDIDASAVTPIIARCTISGTPSTD